METIEKPKFQLLGIKLVNDRFWFVMKVRKTRFSEHNCALIFQSQRIFQVSSEYLATCRKAQKNET